MNAQGDHTVPEGPKAPTYTVTVEGPYGSVNWTVCKALWDILPHKLRIQALDVSGPKVIDPFFSDLTARLLEQVGKGDVAIASLDQTWSFEEIGKDCSYGDVVWQVSQGLWDHIPADSRENLIELVKIRIHEHFHHKVYGPLLVFAYRRLEG